MVLKVRMTQFASECGSYAPTIALSHQNTTCSVNCKQLYNIMKCLVRYDSIKVILKMVGFFSLFSPKSIPIFWTPSKISYLIRWVAGLKLGLCLQESSRIILPYTHYILTFNLYHLSLLLWIFCMIEIISSISDYQALCGVAQSQHHVPDITFYSSTSQ